MSEKNHNTKLGPAAAIAFLDFIRMAQKVQSENSVVLSELNKKQQDLLHDIEIPDKLLKRDITQIGTELRNLRRERRKIKDDLALAEIVMSVLKKNPNMTEDIEYLIEKLGSEEKYFDSRTYTIKSNLIHDTENLDADKLKSTVNKMNIIVSRLIKNWGTATVVNTGKSDVSFTLVNNSYNRSSAISAFNNIKYLLTKELHGIVIEVNISDFPINGIDNMSTLTGVLKCKLKDGTKCNINGSITYPCQSSKPKSSKGKGGRKKK